MLLPWDVSLGLIWQWRSQLPWSAAAGRDLNGDGFNTDLVAGTTRNSGSRNLDLAAVNAYRQANGFAVVSESDIDSSRINIVDMRLNKDVTLRDTLKLQVIVQAFNLFNVKNLQAQYGGGRVGNARSATFGKIQTARPPIQGELGVRLVW